MNKELQWFEEEYPQELLKIKNAPDKIYIRGNSQLLNNQIGTIGIIGSRNSTEYGRKCARIFAEYFAKKGVTVVSGMALGIDTEAHLGALKGVGNTVAVLGSGLNNITPIENEWLYHKIINENGAVITELEDNELAQSSNYQKRNRIISGMATCVLVVESAKLSGSLMTARIAREQGKKVYFLPKQIDSKNSGGMQYLLECGAEVVTRPESIWKNFSKNNNIQEKIVKVDEKYEEIYEELNSEKSIEEISCKLDRDVSEINTLLTMMELEGLIIRTEFGKYQRV